MKRIFLAFFLLSSLFAAAQSRLQEISSTGILVGCRATATTDGGYITVTKNEGQVPYTHTAFKYAANGTLQWQTTVTNGTSKWVADLPHITQTTDGGYIISVLDDLEMHFIKLSRAGKYMWDRTYRRNAGALPSITSLADVKSNNKGSLFVCGQYSTFSKLEGYVARLDETSGNLLWFKNDYSFVPGQNFKSNDQDNFYQLSITQDGGCIVAGVTTQVAKSIVESQFFTLYKYSIAGAREWAKAVAVDQPSGFSSTLVSDFSNLTARSFVILASNNYGQNCYFGLNDTGAVLYAKRINTNFSNDAYYPLAHAAYAPKTKKLYFTSQGKDGRQLNRLVLSSNGDLQQVANTSFETSLYKQSAAIFALKSGALVSTGTVSGSSFDNNDKLYISRLPNNGLGCNETLLTGFSSATASFSVADLQATEALVQPADFKIDSATYFTITETFGNTVTCSSTSFDEDESLSVSAQTVPDVFSAKLVTNPVGNTISLQVLAPSAALVQITLTDMNGRTVKTQTTQVSSGVSSISLPAAELGKGIYLLRIASAGKQQSLKLVKM